MITLLSLTTLQEEVAQMIEDHAKDIRDLVKDRAKSSKEYAIKEKELSRLKRKISKLKDDAELYKMVRIYLSSGVAANSIQEQRNLLMIKLSTIDERLKYNLDGTLREDGPLLRGTRNPEKKH